MYRVTILFIILILVFANLISACKPALRLDQPPEILYGEDVCAECSMIISEARFAAAYYTKSGEVRRFDGVGELCTYYLGHQEESESIWVHDYQTEEWLNAERAYYVISQNLQSPMGQGAVALGDQRRAEQLAAQVGSEVMDFAGILEHFRMKAGEAHNH